MKNFERIERYLNDEMNNSEKTSFENEVAKDKALAVELELQRAENSALDIVAFDVLKNEIASAAALDRKRNAEHEESNKESLTKPSKNKLLRPLLVAASIIFLILAGYWALKEQGTEIPEIVDQPTNTINERNESEELTPIIPESEKKLLPTPENKTLEKSKEKRRPSTKPNEVYRAIALAAEPQDSKVIIRGEGSATQDIQWNQIIDVFSEKKYAEVIDMVNTFDEKHKYFSDAQELKAASLFYTNRFDLAEELYVMCLEKGDAFFKDKYEYELLRCLVGQLPKSNQRYNSLLEKINANQDHTYYNDVQKIQARLKELNN